MKRSKLEILVLVLGALVILGSLFLKFVADMSPEKELIVTNIVFSVGFLIYIVYSMMSTNSLNREIRRLNSHIDSLKTEIAKKDKTLAERQQRIELLEKEKQQAEEQLADTRKQIAELEGEVKKLRSSKKQANP